MAKSYKATISVRCLKQHECVGCGSRFSYLLQRSITGQGGDVAAAQANAEKLAHDSVRDAVDFHPCPQCGLVQPDMHADAQRKYGMWAAGAAAIGFAAALILAAADVVTITASAEIAVGVGIVVFFIFLRGALVRPNRDLDSNRATSALNVSVGTLQLDEAGKSASPVESSAGISGWQKLSLACGALALLAAALPLLLKSVNGWTHNVGCYPEVVGPGDTTCFYFDQKIKSVQGKWQGRAQATIVEGEALGTGVSLTAATKNESWGNTISGKRVSNETKRMYVKVTFPETERLAGKTVKLDLSVDAEFPEMIGGGGFVNSTETFQHRAEAALSSPGAGTLFMRSWWMGQSAAIFLSILGVACANRSCNVLRSRSNPTLVAPIE